MKVIPFFDYYRSKSCMEMQNEKNKKQEDIF